MYIKYKLNEIHQIVYMDINIQVITWALITKLKKYSVSPSYSLLPTLAT